MPKRYKAQGRQGDTMLTLIGIFPKNGKNIARPVQIRKYNEAVPKLNAMLKPGKATDFLLPEERPDLARKSGLL